MLAMSEFSNAKMFAGDISPAYLKEDISLLAR